jgi:site-specific recombinase XerD
MNRTSSSCSSGSAKKPRGAILGPILQRYFCDYLINQRQFSPQTIAAYRDAFKLLLRFVERAANKPCDNLTIDDIDAPVVLEFLADLEKRRGNLARSRNARLAAIRSFFRYAASTDPLILPVAQRVLAVPSKRFDRPTIGHLTRVQMQLILQTPNPSTASGARDQVLLLLMYNTGARVSEIAGLRVKDLQFGGAGTAKLHLYGKGRKQRTVPLWRSTTRLLRNGLHERAAHSPDDPLVPSAQGRPMTRSGITSRLRVAVEIAAKHDASLATRTISPHTIRHTTAMHLLQSGVDLSVIAMWLGHEHLQTTHQYLDADIHTKQLALAHLESPATPRRPPRTQRPLMQFLKEL